jgi:hypothetical protein
MVPSATRPDSTESIGRSVSAGAGVDVWALAIPSGLMAATAAVPTPRPATASVAARNFFMTAISFRRGCPEHRPLM